MPIIQPKPSAPAAVAPVLPKIQSAATKSVIIDTQVTPRSTLMSYVEGSVYTVDYFSQILSEDSATYGLDPRKSAVLQQFKKVSSLEIRLTSPLAQQQDPQDKTFTVRGEGHITAGVIPNEGDMFAADVGDGREGIFQVNSSEKRSLFSESVYLIEFQLLFFSASDATRRTDLENKVAARYHYVRDFARWGRNPIVADSTFFSLVELKILRQRMAEHYLTRFVSRNVATLVLPGQTQVVYDPFVAKTFHAINSVDTLPQLQRVRLPALDDDDQQIFPVLWDALLKRNPDLLMSIAPKMGMVSTGAFAWEGMLRSIRYSGIDQVIYPLPFNQSIDSFNSGLTKGITATQPTPVPSPSGDVALMARSSDIVLPDGMVPLLPVLTDDYYVFSEAFYKNSTSISLLEKLTMDYLQGEGIAAEQVHWLASNYAGWGGLEQFYYIPILIILIQSLMTDAV